MTAKLLSLNYNLIRNRKAYGGVAQLGEHLPCKQGVRSSILLISTIFSLIFENRTAKKSKVLVKALGFKNPAKENPK